MIRGRSSNEQSEQKQAGGTTDLSIVAHGLRIQGDCESTGTLRVEGHVTGSVRARSLHVARSGRVDGDVSGQDGGSSEEAVLIEGHVEGTLRAPRVEVRREGTVGGGLITTEAVVEGRVTGGIIAEQRLLLGETAIVEGDVRARRLALKEGGRVAGTIRIGEATASEEAKQQRGGERQQQGAKANTAAAAAPAAQG
ncbi:MAG: bactofilin family protein [Longimicrobiales bacterium]